MNEQDIKILIELARKKLQEKPSEEEALKALQLAGILDENGVYTTPYEELARLAG